MTDLELLELAAKAAGYDIAPGPMIWSEDEAEYIAWNPLTDDGDALRLAVQLNMYMATEMGKSIVSSLKLVGWISESHGSDACAATRRAIVRAAAEIGRKMP